MGGREHQRYGTRGKRKRKRTTTKTRRRRRKEEGEGEEEKKPKMELLITVLGRVDVQDTGFPRLPGSVSSGW